MPGHVRARGKRKDSTTIWQARWRPADDVSDRNREESNHRTKRDAERWIAQRDSDVLRGAYAPAKRGEAMVSALADELRGVWTAKGLEPKTRAGYEAILSRWLVGDSDPLRPGRPCRFARVKVAAVTTKIVQEFVEEVGATRAPNTVCRIYGVLNSLMKLAAQRGYVAANPCSAVEMPTKRRAGVRRSRLYLEGGEVQRVNGRREEGEEEPENAKAMTRAELAAVLGKLPADWRLFFELLAHTGLRVSEALGLDWSDVDFGARPRLRVRRQFYRGTSKRLKTRAGRRDLPLSPGMARQLWAAARPRWDGPTFATRTGTRYADRSVRRVLRRRRRPDGQGQVAGVSASLKPRPFRPILHVVSLHGVGEGAAGTQEAAAERSTERPARAVDGGRVRTRYGKGDHWVYTHPQRRFPLTIDPRNPLLPAYVSKAIRAIEEVLDDEQDD